MSYLNHSTSKRLRPAVILLAVLAALTAVNCSGYGVISELLNDRVTLKIKGTYESQDARAWQTLYIDNNAFDRSDDPANETVGITRYHAEVVDTSKGYFTDAATAVPISQNDINKYIDFGEIRLSGGHPYADFLHLVQENTTEDFWQFFVRDRRVFCSRYYATDDDPTEPDPDTCEKFGGKSKLSKMMSGAGATYPAVDVPSDRYHHLGVFMRRMVFDRSKVIDRTITTEETVIDGQTQTILSKDDFGDYIYDADADGSLTSADFDTFVIKGEDYLTFSQYRADQNPDPTTVPPLLVPLNFRTGFGKNDQMVVDDSYDPYVLELRIFLRNLLMLHRYNRFDNSTQFYIGLSDWRLDHPVDITDNAFYNGGNLVTRGRIYYPSRVGQVVVNDGGGALDTTSVVATSSTAEAAQWLSLETSKVSLADLRADRGQMPYVAAPTDGASTITFKNVMPGEYVLYRTCDLTGSAPKNSFVQNAKIAFNPDADTSTDPAVQTALAKLANEGFTISVKLFGKQVNGIHFSGATVSDAVQDLRRKLRVMGFQAEFNDEGDAIEIEPDLKTYWTLNDFVIAGTADDELFETDFSSVLTTALATELLATEPEVDFRTRTTQSTGASVAYSTDYPGLRTGPDGFPEEIRKCGASFTVSKGETVNLADLDAASCPCGGAY